MHLSCWAHYVCNVAIQMKKGWKTRIQEREYFENKKNLREEKAAFLALMKQKMEMEYQLRLQELKDNHEIN
jgi:hypothetical protein